MRCVTVITPSYNRAHLLPALFASLCAQTCKDFEWLVVDDGSIDHTEAVVSDLVGKADFPVRYLYKQNGGKHTALNAGIRTIQSKLTVIVDSDDVLLPNAIGDIVAYDEKYREVRPLAGFSFLKVLDNGKVVVPMDSDEFIDTYIDYRIAQNRPGDMAEVFYTEVLKAHPFPEFPGERFLSEDVVWIEISKEGPFVFVNKAIYQCEYLAEGLTANDKPMKFASPKGSMLRGKQLMHPACGLKANIRGAIIYNCYHKLVSGPLDQALLVSGRERMLVWLTKPLGTVFYHKWNPNRLRGIEHQ